VGRRPHGYGKSLRTWIKQGKGPVTVEIQGYTLVAMEKQGYASGTMEKQGYASVTMEKQGKGSGTKEKQGKGPVTVEGQGKGSSTKGSRGTSRAPIDEMRLLIRITAAPFFGAVDIKSTVGPTLNTVSLYPTRNPSPSPETNQALPSAFPHPTIPSLLSATMRTSTSSPAPASPALTPACALSAHQSAATNTTTTDSGLPATTAACSSTPTEELPPPPPSSQQASETDWCPDFPSSSELPYPLEQTPPLPPSSQDSVSPDRACVSATAESTDAPLLLEEAQDESSAAPQPGIATSSEVAANTDPSSIRPHRQPRDGLRQILDVAIFNSRAGLNAPPRLGRPPRAPVASRLFRRRRPSSSTSLPEASSSASLPEASSGNTRATPRRTGRTAEDKVSDMYSTYASYNLLTSSDRWRAPSCSQRRP
jgi:hypothetical protein